MCKIKNTSIKCNICKEGTIAENFSSCIRNNKTYMLYFSKYYRYMMTLNFSEVLGNETTANNFALKNSKIKYTKL